MTEVRFARSGDVDVAYRVVGVGPIDLVYVLGFMTHLEVLWELPQFRRFCERLAEFTRLVVFDKRGMGMSDRVPGATTLEERMDDVRAVMDAVGSERAALMGASEGGPLSMLFAAAHPERTSALILQGAEVRERTDDDWPWGEATAQEFEDAMATLHDRWGQGLSADWVAPSVSGEEWTRACGADCRHIPGRRDRPRRSCEWPSTSMFVTSSLPFRVPTLVLHSTGDRVCHVENGRFLGRTIRGARYLELPGEDHVP